MRGEDLSLWPELYALFPPPPWAKFMLKSFTTNIFGDRAFKKVIKGKGCHKGGGSNPLGPVSEEKETSESQGKRSH